MKISTKGRYALRIMVDLAIYENGSYIALKDIAKRQDISLKYLEQIMRLLSAAQFVRSARGSQGGYKLTRSADQITAKEVLIASEGSLNCVSCVDDPESCERCSHCATSKFWVGLSKVIDEYLSSYTLKDIANEYQKNNYDYII